MARIIWQNVAAPDFSDAINARSKAAELFSRAASGFSSAVGDIDANNTENLNLAAADQAIRINDLGQFDRVLSEQGLGGFGISTDQATPDLLDFVQGRRTDLASQETANRALANQEAGLNRQRILDERADLAFNRSEEQRALEAAAAVEAERALRSSFSVDEARRSLINSTDNPALLDLGLQRIDGQGNRFNIVPGTELPETFNNDMQTTRDIISLDRSREQIANSTDPLFSIWSTSPDTYAQYDSPVNGLVERLRGQLDPGDIESNRTTFDRSVRSIESNFDTLQERFPNVPPAMLARVMENSLAPTSLLNFSGSERTFDNDTIEEQLTALNDPQRQASLSEQALDVENRQKIYSTAEEKMDRLSQRLGVSINRGSPQSEIDAILEDMAKLRADTAEVLEGVPPTSPGGNGTGGGTGNPTPEQQLAASVLNRPVQGPPSPPVNGIDPRITSTRNAVGEFASEILRSGDDMLGDAAAVTSRILNQANAGAARVAGLAFPRFASDMLSNIDRQNADADRIARDGLFGTVLGPIPFEPTRVTGAPSPDDLGFTEPVPLLDPGISDGPTQDRNRPLVVQQAQQDPNTAIETIGVEAGLSPNSVSVARIAMRVLNDTGSNRGDRANARTIIENFIRDARTSDGNLSPEAQALVDNAEAWIRR